MEFVTNNINLIGFSLTIFLLLAVLFKRATKTPSEHLGAQDLDAINKSLSEAEQLAAGTSALAEERKSEVDRLNQDLSKLRTKMDDLNEKSRVQSI